MNYSRISQSLRPPLMKLFPACFLHLAVHLILVSTVHAQGIQVLIYPKIPLDGYPGLEVDSITGNSDLSSSGYYLSEVKLSGEGVTTDNDSAVLSISPEGEMKLLAREGDGVTGTTPAGSTFVDANTILVDASGAVVFSGRVSIPNGFNETAFFRGTSTGVETFAYKGFPIGEKSLQLGAIRQTDNGRFAFSGNLSLTQDTIWRNDPVDDDIIVTENVSYTGSRTDGFFSVVERAFDLNQNGEVLFFATERWKPDPFLTVADSGIWITNGNTIIPIVGDEDPAPGLPGIEVELGNSLGSAGIADNDWVTFAGQLTGDGVTNANDECLFASDRQTSYIVAREGDPAPGTIGDFGNSLRIETISPSGTVLFNNRIDLPDQTTAQSAWTWKSGQLKLIAIAGQEAPGFPTLTFTRVEFPVISREGRVAFQGRLSNNHTGIWITDADGNNLKYVIGKDDVMPQPDGGTALIAGVTIENVGSRFPFDADGWLLVNLSSQFATNALALVDPDAERASISGQVLDDTDLNGDFSQQDTGYSNVKVELFNDDGQGNPSGLSLVVTHTDNDGFFSFTGVESGAYVIQATIPDEFNFIKDTAEPSDDRLIPLSYTAGENSPDHNFLMALKPISIEGIVLDDSVGNTGDFSEDDISVLGLTVQLFANDGQGKPTGPALQEDLTNVDGRYFFEDVPTGDYVVTLVVPSEYGFIKDSTAPEDDICIPTNYTAGTTITDQKFLLSKKLDIDLRITLHTVDENGATNVEEGVTGIDLPLQVTTDIETLDTQPSVVRGLVADGVTPLLFRIDAFGADFSQTRKLKAEIVELSGGDIPDGLANHLQVLQGGAWGPETGEFFFPSPKSAWFYIRPIASDNLFFDEGSNEINAKLTVTDIVSGRVLSTGEFSIRRPVVTLIHGYNTPGFWGDVYREELGKTRPVSEGIDNFVITIRYGQNIVEDLGRLVSPIADQGRGNTVYTLFYLARILQKELDDALEPVHERWAFNRHDVIAHSQGGLLSRLLCSEDPTTSLKTFLPAPVRPFQSIENLNRGRFHRVVTIGSPHNGSRLVRYLIELMRLRLRVNLLDHIPTDVAWILYLTGTVRDKFDPLSRQIQWLNDPAPNARWKPDPDAKFHLVRARINQGMPPSSSSAVVGNRALGLAGPGGAIVLPFGSDAVVDFESMGAHSPGQAASTNVYSLPANLEISHSGPIPLFSRSPLSPATGETASPEAAAHIRQALDQDTSRPPEEIVFGPFILPRQLTAAELQPIADFALTREISEEGQVVPAAGQTESQATATPSMHADNQLFATAGDSLDIALKLNLAPEHALQGEVLWLIERFGINGPEQLTNSIVVNAEDSTEASLIVPNAVSGEYIVHASYYSTEDVLVFAEPFVAANIQASDAEIVGLQLRVSEEETLPGSIIRPILTITYSDGTTLSKAPVGVTFTSSEEEVLELSSTSAWKALTKGNSVVTADYAGLKANTLVQVQDPAQQGELSYSDWLSAYFSEEELDNELISGPSISSDMDPFGNAIEFLFAQDPRNPDSDGAFSPHVLTAGGQAYAATRLELRSDLAGMEVTLQNSRNLETWDDLFSVNDALETVFSSPLIIDSKFSQGINRLTIRSDTPLSELSDQEFFRIQIQLPEE